MKKKILALCLVVVLAITAVTGATLAYFTDTDQDTNTFTVGNVKIIQREHQRNLDDNIVREVDGAPLAKWGELETFENGKPVFPAIHEKLLPKVPITAEGYDFQIRDLEGNYIDKIVSVYNDGTEDAYMRTIIAVPNMNGYDDDANATENPLHWNYLAASDFNGTGWDWNGSEDTEVIKQDDKVAAVTIDGMQYDLYIATYNKAVAPATWTSPSMVGFYLDESVNCDENGYFAEQNGQRIDLSQWMTPNLENGEVELKFLVATQACQTEGFDDAWEALDKAFGDITATNHPWVPTT